ncbi:MAG TPA: hypothetical protein VGJ05_09090 [Fimbriiglobus sp.]|jgi:hypothetical protein
MTIRFACPCGQELEAEAEHAGLATVCPQCQRELTIPAAKSRPPVARLAPPDLPDTGFTVVGDPPLPSASRPKPPPPRPRPPLTNRYDDDGAPARSRRDAEEDEDVRPRKNRHYDDDEAHDDEEDSRRPRMKRRKKRYDEPTGVNWTMVGGGALLMIGMAVWFIVGWIGGIIFFKPPIGFVIGLIAVVKGLMGHQKD